VVLGGLIFYNERGAPALGIGLLLGPRKRKFLIGEVPLYTSLEAGATSPHSGLQRYFLNSLCFSTTVCPFGSLRRPQRVLPTETKVESGTSQSKSGTSVNSSNRE